MTGDAFELQPTLVGDLVMLRPLAADDYEALYLAARDPLIWEQHPDADRWREPVFREFFAGALASGGAFAVLERAGGAIVGSTRYFGHDPVRREIEIGWTFLVRAHWGGRSNREMKRLMLAHAFRFVDTVVFYVGPGNRRSQRAVEAIGATLRERRVRGGRENLVYAITAATHRA